MSQDWVTYSNTFWTWKWNLVSLKCSVWCHLFYLNDLYHVVGIHHTHSSTVAHCLKQFFFFACIEHVVHMKDLTNWQKCKPVHELISLWQTEFAYIFFAIPLYLLWQTELSGLCVACQSSQHSQPLKKTDDKTNMLLFFCSARHVGAKRKAQANYTCQGDAHVTHQRQEDVVCLSGSVMERDRKMS